MHLIIQYVISHEDVFVEQRQNVILDNCYGKLCYGALLETVLWYCTNLSA